MDQKRPKKKAGDPGQELAELRRRLELTQMGARQIQTAVDALLTAVALKFGTETGSGEKRLELPGFSVAELGEAYILQAARGAEGKGYVLTVRPREKGMKGDGERTGGEEDQETRL